MEDKATRAELDHDTCIHICGVSAALVGVCLTTIGLIRVVVALNKVDTVADDLLAIDAVVFLFATLTSYWALRTRSTKRRPVIERMADTAFVSGILLMTVICVFIAVTLGSSLGPQ